MYKLFSLLILSTICFSCGKNYRINGSSTVSLLDGKMLFIKVSEGDHLIKIDSAEVVHGKFEMEGNIDTTIMAVLYMDDQAIMPFVVEKGNINISIDNIGMRVGGTPLNDTFNQFVIEQNKLSDKAYEVERLESRMIMDGHKYDDVQVEINNKRQNLSNEMNTLVKVFIKNNYENVLGAGVFVLLCGDMQAPKVNPLMKEILLEAPQSFKEIPCIKELVTLAEKD